MRALAEPWGESLSSPPCLGRPDVSRTGALTLGLNAEDFSDAVLPVSELQAHVMMSLEPQLERGAREGHSFVLLRLGSGDGDGWPLRLQRLGTYEGLGDGGKVELNLGSGGFKEEVRPNGLVCSGGDASGMRAGQALWQLLGVPQGVEDATPLEA